MGDLRGLVVSNLGGERGDQHQRILDVPLHFGAVDLEALEHVFDITVAGVGDERDRVQKVVDNYRLEHVEFEVTLRAGESDGGSCAVNLYADHSHGFALRRIDLAGHDG